MAVYAAVTLYLMSLLNLNRDDKAQESNSSSVQVATLVAESSNQSKLPEKPSGLNRPRIDAPGKVSDSVA